MGIGVMGMGSIEGIAEIEDELPTSPPPPPHAVRTTMDTKQLVSNERWFMVCPSGHLDETGPRVVAASRWLVASMRQPAR
jgi:hypothetical protein